jgi:predicted transcriptional regulator
MSDEDNGVIEMTADIVSAYVGNNTVSVTELPNLIKNIHDALKGVSTGVSAEPVAPQTPAVSVRKSITPEFLICLEDGRKFKSLKRHLHTKYDLTPEAYRTKWGLPKDYPMVAPDYAASRSALAKSMGLGQGGRQAAKPVAAAKAPTVRKPRAAKVVG